MEGGRRSSREGEYLRVVLEFMPVHSHKVVHKRGQMRHFTGLEC